MCRDTVAPGGTTIHKTDVHRAATLYSAFEPHTGCVGDDILSRNNSQSTVLTKKEKETMIRSHSADECKGKRSRESTIALRAYQMSLMQFGGACLRKGSLEQLQREILESEEVVKHLRSVQITIEQVMPKWANGAMVLFRFTELDAKLYNITLQPNHVLAPTSLIPLIKNIVCGQVTVADKEMMEERDLPLGASASWMYQRA